MGADDNAITIGRWHREVERALESSGLTYTILRPNGFMQNFVTATAARSRRSMWLTFATPSG